MKEDKRHLTNEEVLKYLKQRIWKTKEARIEASYRLRAKHNFFEKITNIYSLIILILSVWFLNSDEETGVLATRILLVLSLTMTYFTMYLNTKNYKERAGNFETNYQQLDVLLNKINRYEIDEVELNHDRIKSLQREYEKLLIGKENHLNIDYYNAMTKRKKEDYSIEIMKERLKDWVSKVFICLFPIIVLIIIYVFNIFLNIFP